MVRDPAASDTSGPGGLGRDVQKGTTAPSRSARDREAPRRSRTTRNSKTRKLAPTSTRHSWEAARRRTHSTSSAYTATSPTGSEALISDVHSCFASRKSARSSYPASWNSNPSGRSEMPLASTTYPGCGDRSDPGLSVFLAFRRSALAEWASGLRAPGNGALNRRPTAQRADYGRRSVGGHHQVAITLSRTSSSISCPSTPVTRP